MSVDNAIRPIAVMPDRLMVFNEAEQEILLTALAAQRQSEIAEGARKLYDRVAEGETYTNSVDELTRLTKFKRTLDSAKKHINKRIKVLDELVIEEWTEAGTSGVKHEGTGATLSKKAAVWVKLEIDTEDMTSDEEAEARADFKAQVAPHLTQAGLGDMVKEDFNLNTVSAYFREIVNEALDAQKALPEEQRRPVDPDRFLPEPLHGLLRIDMTPTVQVRF